MAHLRAPLVLAALIVAAAPARPDGAFVWRRGADLNEPAQKAVIGWDGKTQTLVLQVKYEGPADDFAWVVPLPSRPQVDAIEAAQSPFPELSLYTQRRARWGLRGPMDTEKTHGVAVLERKVVGVYDVAVLAATDPAALSKWLNANGYAFPSTRTDVLEHYTAKRWFYVAMRIDRKALGSQAVKKLKIGELQPVRFRFPTRQPVYPLKISSINAGTTEVLLYVLTRTPLAVANPGNRRGLAIDGNIPRFLSKDYTDPAFGTYRKATANELPLTWKALGTTADTPLSLCTFRTLYKTNEMTDDLAFAPFQPQPHWDKRLRSEVHWNRKLAILNFLMQRDEARYAQVLQKLLTDWAGSADADVRRRAAAHPASPPALLARLADDKDANVRVAVAMNKQAPRAALTSLARDPTERVRSLVARNPSAEPGLLDTLARDKNLAVASAAVGNPHIPAATLRKLAAGARYELRASVALQPHCPRDLLVALAKANEQAIRACLATNRAAPPQVLADLARDHSNEVRRRVAENHAAPPAVLESLAQDANASVRQAVARSARTPPRALAALAADPHAAVLEHLTSNAATPKDALLLLVRGSRRGIAARARRALQQRGIAERKVPAIPKDGPVDPKTAIAAMAAWDFRLRCTATEALARSDTSEATHALLACLRDPAPEVRCAAASALGARREPQAAKPIADLLTNPAVRKAAAKALVQIGKPAVVHIAPHARAEDPKLRTAVADALAAIGDPQAAPAIVPLLDDPVGQVREHAAKALGTLGGDAAAQALLRCTCNPKAPIEDRGRAVQALGAIRPPATQPLITVLGIEDPGGVRVCAVRSLAALGQQAIPAVLAAAAHENWRVRDGVAEALGTTKAADPRIAPALVGLLGTHEKVSSRAFWSLCQRKDPAATPALIAALKSTEPKKRTWTAEVMGRLGDVRAIPPLLDASVDPEYSVRYHARQAMNRLATPQAVDSLAKGLKHENPRVRWAAAQALGHTGAASAVAPLTVALKDPDPEVRHGATQALARLRSPAKTPR